MENIFKTKSENETKNVGVELGKKLRGGEVIIFFGDLGAGKTAFTKGLCEGLGIDAEVTSPTFSLVNEYKGAKNLCHFDMYRIETEEELESIGFYDYLQDENVIAIEWAENVLDFLPEWDYEIHIEKNSTNERTVTIKGGE
jgi:tRNA threonylcarbamoyladenosine biosynthesis protein TsaE